jgi:hypothetical protein
MEQTVASTSWMGAETIGGNASGVTGEMASSSAAQFASSGATARQRQAKRFMRDLERNRVRVRSHGSRIAT